MRQCGKAVSTICFRITALPKTVRAVATMMAVRVLLFAISQGFKVPGLFSPRGNYSLHLTNFLSLLFFTNSCSSSSRTPWNIALWYASSSIVPIKQVAIARSVGFRLSDSLIESWLFNYEQVALVSGQYVQRAVGTMIMMI